MRPLFVVLTGVLGSGKTTQIERYMPSAQASDTAVIVNDIAEIDIDGVIVSSATEVPTVTLSNGCICCSLASDLQITLTTLLERRRQQVGRPFERIILECTGMADAGAVLRHIGEIDALDMEAVVVCTVAVNQQSWPEQVREIALSQLACAQRVVLTKHDLASSKEIRSQQHTAERLAPFATVINESQPDRRAQLAFGDAKISRHRTRTLAPRPLDARQAGHDIQTYVIGTDGAQPWAVYADWIEDVAGTLDNRLLRLKGLLQTTETEQMVLVQGVGRFFDQPRRLTVMAQPTSIVLITHNVQADEIRGLVQDYSGLRVTNT